MSAWTIEEVQIIPWLAYMFLWQHTFEKKACLCKPSSDLTLTPWFWMHIQLVQADCSVLELYVLVCMRRLEVKEKNSYNFNTVMKGLLLIFFFLVITSLILLHLSTTYMFVILGRVQKHTWFFQDVWLLCTKCVLTGMKALFQFVYEGS